MPGVDGKTYSLGGFKDKPILVVTFWCNHCPYVQAWEDRTIAVQKDFAGRGVQFVMINANDEQSYPEDDFANMVERAKQPYMRQVLDSLLAGKEPPVTFIPSMGCSIKWKDTHWH